jgi:phytoene desaturase
METKRYSCSTISFFWGVKKSYDKLPPHTLYLSEQYQENFECLSNGATIPEDPSLYFHAPVRLDPSFAPPGEDTLIGIVPVGHLRTNGQQDWEQIKQRARAALLKKLADLGVDDLERNLKFEVCYTPRQWRNQFNLVHGATHGLCHTLNQMVCFRPSNRHKRYQNLYFVGASTHPGTGMPTVMISGRLVSERVLREWGAPHASSSFRVDGDSSRESFMPQRG